MRKGVALILCLALAGHAAPAAASIEQAKALACAAPDGSNAFTIIFDHDLQQAKVADAAGTRLYAYEQGEAFLTWRLVDEEGKRHLLIRQGDAINGDLGWYFTAFALDPGGTAELTVSGTCSKVD